MQIRDILVLVGFLASLVAYRSLRSKAQGHLDPETKAVTEQLQRKIQGYSLLMMLGLILLFFVFGSTLALGRSTLIWVYFLLYGLAMLGSLFWTYHKQKSLNLPARYVSTMLRADGIRLLGIALMIYYLYVANNPSLSVM